MAEPDALYQQKFKELQGRVEAFNRWQQDHEKEYTDLALTVQGLPGADYPSLREEIKTLKKSVDELQKSVDLWNQRFKIIQWLLTGLTGATGLSMANALLNLLSRLP